MSDRSLTHLELEKQIGDLQAVLEVSRELVATSDLDELLRCVERAAVTVLECEHASIQLCNPTGGGFLERTAGPSMPSAAARQVVKTGKPVHSNRAAVPQEAPSPTPDRGESSSDRTSAFPLLGRSQEIVGVLEAVNHRPFDPWDLELVGVFDSHVGIALQRQLLLDELAEKQRIERDLKIARSIQQGLLPASNPKLPGFDIAGWNRPADDTGGDFWDYLMLPDRGLAMTVADATGHGIGPALVMASCRALIRATCSLSQNLVEIVDRVNRLLCADLEANLGVTAFLGRLELTTNQLHYLSAGHGPLFWLANDGSRVELLNANAVPLGFFPEMNWPQPASRVMAPGDIMVVVTDGFFEWENPSGEEFGIDRLAEVIAQNREKSAVALIQEMYGQVRHFVGGAIQTDDLTALVIKCQP